MNIGDFKFTGGISSLLASDKQFYAPIAKGWLFANACFIVGSKGLSEYRSRVKLAEIEYKNLAQHEKAMKFNIDIARKRCKDEVYPVKECKYTKFNGRVSKVVKLSNGQFIDSFFLRLFADTFGSRIRLFSLSGAANIFNTIIVKDKDGYFIGCMMPCRIDEKKLKEISNAKKKAKESS